MELELNQAITAAIYWPIVPALCDMSMIVQELVEWWVAWEAVVLREDMPQSVPLSPPQIPRELNRNRTRVVRWEATE
jgi:hypothetical protein